MDAVGGAPGARRGLRDAARWGLASTELLSCAGSPRALPAHAGKHSRENRNRPLASRNSITALAVDLLSHWANLRDSRYCSTTEIHLPTGNAAPDAASRAKALTHFDVMAPAWAHPPDLTCNSVGDAFGDGLASCDGNSGIGAVSAGSERIHVCARRASRTCPAERRQIKAISAIERRHFQAPEGLMSG